MMNVSMNALIRIRFCLAFYCFARLLSATSALYALEDCPSTFAPSELDLRAFEERNRELNSDGVPKEKLPQILHHGRMTDFVLVFFHGVGEWPESVKWIPSLFHKQGVNVYMPLFPGHGRKEHDLAPLTVEDYRAAFEKEVLFAKTLGKKVITAGSSYGATIVMDALANPGNRSVPGDVLHAFLASPVFKLSPAMENHLSKKREEGFESADHRTDPDRFYFFNRENADPMVNSRIPVATFHMLWEMSLGTNTQQAKDIDVLVSVIHSKFDKLADTSETRRVIETNREHLALEWFITKKIDHWAVARPELIAKEEVREGYTQEMDQFVSFIVKSLRGGNIPQNAAWPGLEDASLLNGLKNDELIPRQNGVSN